MYSPIASPQESGAQPQCIAQTRERQKTVFLRVFRFVSAHFLPLGGFAQSEFFRHDQRMIFHVWGRYYVRSRDRFTCGVQEKAFRSRCPREATPQETQLQTLSARRNNRTPRQLTAERDTANVGADEFCWTSTRIDKWIVLS